MRILDGREKKLLLASEFQVEDEVPIEEEDGGEYLTPIVNKLKTSGQKVFGIENFLWRSMREKAAAAWYLEVFTEDPSNIIGQSLGRERLELKVDFVKTVEQKFR